jgi:hypothetical protein
MADRFNDYANTAIKKIEDTNAAYAKQMQLQASVNYWGGQSTAQAVSARWLARMLPRVMGAELVRNKRSPY